MEAIIGQIGTLSSALAKDAHSDIEEEVKTEVLNALQPTNETLTELKSMISTLLSLDSHK